MAKLRKYAKGANVKLSEHFHLSEYACKCKYDDCKEVIVDLDHIQKLEELRSKLGKSISITCGHRCQKHNKDVGGVSNSQHVLGIATDIQVAGVTPNQVADLSESIFNALGRYDTFTHVDSRDSGGKPKARWDFRKK